MTVSYTCTGTKVTKTVSATLPILPSLGAAVVQKTVAASVPRNRPSWTNITFRGNKAGIGNFRVSLTPPNGLVVSYPADANSAGLNNEATLQVGDDDHVAVRLDASGLAPGVYQIPVHATYTGGSFDGQLALTVT
jgi:hypothetical protein